MVEFTVRPAEVEDLCAIVEIYNAYILKTPVTFDIKAFTVEGRKPWFEQFKETGPHRLLVAEVDGVVAGYASSCQHRSKAAYDRSVEATIYFHADHIRRGGGRVLYGSLFRLLASEPTVHRAFAGITLPNAGSIALHERLGFTPVGVFKEIGFKFGRFWDVAWYELDVSCHAA